MERTSQSSYPSTKKSSKRKLQSDPESTPPFILDVNETVQEQEKETKQDVLSAPLQKKLGEDLFLDDESIDCMMAQANEHASRNLHPTIYFFSAFYFNASFHYCPVTNPLMKCTKLMSQPWTVAEWKHRLKRIKYKHSTLLSYFRKQKITRFFFPINHGGHSHWLAVLVDFKTRTCTYIDSSPGLSSINYSEEEDEPTLYEKRVRYFESSLHALDGLYRQKSDAPLLSESHSKWKSTWRIVQDWTQGPSERISPDQTDGHSCAIHVILTAGMLTQETHPNVTLPWKKSILRRCRTYIQEVVSPLPTINPLSSELALLDNAYSSFSNPQYRLTTSTTLSKEVHSTTFPAFFKCFKHKEILLIRLTSLLSPDVYPLTDVHYMVAIVHQEYYNPFTSRFEYNLFTPFGLILRITEHPDHLVALNQDRIASLKCIQQLQKLYKKYEKQCPIIHPFWAWIFIHDSSFPPTLYKTWLAETHSRTLDQSLSFTQGWILFKEFKKEYEQEEENPELITEEEEERIPPDTIYLSTTDIHTI